MADEIRQVEHYAATIPDKVGEGARMLGALRDAGVNLIAFWGYPSGKGKAQLEFVPENGAAFVAAAKQAKLRLRKNTALYVCGDDRPGAVAREKARGGTHQRRRFAGRLRWSGNLRGGDFPPACRCSEGRDGSGSHLASS
jgi:hypothetical protein